MKLFFDPIYQRSIKIESNFEWTVNYFIIKTENNSKATDYLNYYSNYSLPDLFSKL
jgi:hypothetical protein